MKKTHVVGLVLWRGGMILALAYVAYWGMRSLLTITDPQLEIGVAVGLAGLILVFVSVVMERVQDARSERDRLADDGL